MNNQDREILRSRGYDEKEINFILERYHSVEIFDQAMGPGRQDKGVIVKDEKGKTKRTSNLMFGYNKQGIQLPNGELVNDEEIEVALTTYLESLVTKNEFFVCKKTGKKVGIESIVKVVIETAKKAGVVIYSESDIELNQDVRKVEVRGKDSEKIKSQGLAMLGNDQIELPCGEYCSLEEVYTALNYYVLISPKSPKPPYVPSDKNPEPTKPDPDKQNEKYIVNVRRKTLLPILSIIMAIVTFLTSFGIKVDEKTVAKYLVNEVETVQVYEGEEETRRRIYSDFVVGKKQYIESGIEFHESSDYDSGGKNNTGTFGSSIRKEGEYTLDHISILYNGQIKTVSSKDGEDLYKVVQKTAKDLGVEVQDLKIRLHFGNAVSGWVDLGELINDEDLTPKVIEEKVVIKTEYKGIQDFDGKLSFQTKDGNFVELDVLDKDGNTIDNGSVIKGSDGKLYEISNLQVEQVDGEKRITFDVQDFAKKTAIALSAAALLAYALKKIKENIEERDIIEEAGDEELGIPRVTYAPRSEARKVSDNIVYNLNGEETITEGKKVLGQNIETTKENFETVKRLRDRWHSLSRKKRAWEKLKGRQPDFYVILQRLNEGSLNKEEVDNMYVGVKK